jgi:hypothetical protein
MSGFFKGGAIGATFTQGTAGMPDSNHGTFCAGMVGARRGNAVGGVGAAPDCELMLVACLGDQVGTQTTLARAVAYAANPATEVPGADPADGADIVVSSLGPNGADWDLTTTLQLAIEGAAAAGRQGRGLAIFWAASNGRNVSVSLDEVVSHPDVIAVVRSTRGDLEDNAARGPEVELIAPGVDVFSTESGDDYGTSTGTSFAAPCAAGCAALALSVNPDLTRDELRRVMRASADQIGGVVYDATGHNDDYGFGRVNAFQAVVLAARRVQLLTPSAVFADVPEGETAARAVVWEVGGVQDLTFEVVSGPVTVSGPADAFAVLNGTSVVAPAPGVGVVGHARLWLTYTGATAGSTATGEVVVRCVQTGEQWTVSLSANTVAREGRVAGPTSRPEESERGLASAGLVAALRDDPRLATTLDSALRTQRTSLTALLACLEHPAPTGPTIDLRGPDGTPSSDLAAAGGLVDARMLVTALRAAAAAVEQAAERNRAGR